jgi:hypothetical protein
MNENSEMKKFLLLLILSVSISCSTTKKSSLNLQEDQFFVTRRYIGNFLDYYHTEPRVVGDNDLIWIKTTIYSNFGKISAYGKTCDFSVGDKIYLKPTSSTPGEFGYWEYQIENDSLVSYKVSDYRFENNVFLRTRSL